MFKSMVKDISGTADICSVATKLEKLQGAAYLLPREEILFAFASAKEEFVFTNEALITVRGENATTTRKLVARYEFREHQLSHVQFETTGRVDRDCEIKFQIGDEVISIDIERKEEELVKAHYKALVALAREQHDRRRAWDNAKRGLDKAADALKLKDASDDAASLTAQASSTLKWLEDDFERLCSRNYRNAIVPALPRRK
ncbi:hypothetical protein PybrP1_011660 [[Pythium] brassicae (nom. inval.)]|nr:hypothetical protein PybrP1_011660 [[Pythium] brassicae (nom. inval.)]